MYENRTVFSEINPTLIFYSGKGFVIRGTTFAEESGEIYGRAETTASDTRTSREKNHICQQFYFKMMFKLL